jgi:hypothetical protein
MIQIFISMLWWPENYQVSWYQLYSCNSKIHMWKVKHYQCIFTQTLKYNKFSIVDICILITWPGLVFQKYLHIMLVLWLFKKQFSWRTGRSQPSYCSRSLQMLCTDNYTCSAMCSFIADPQLWCLSILLVTVYGW